MKTILVIPCYNEEKILEKNIKLILKKLRELQANIHIIISNNNSKDKTAEISKRLARENSEIEYFFVSLPGKGNAVLEAWKNINADIYGFMDADLSTDLEALPKVFAELKNGYDIVIGSRRIKGAIVSREFFRKLTSFVLNFIIRLAFDIKIKDTPCGFKFFKREALDKILPDTKNRNWVFDTEMLILAQRAGLKIKELPVRWKEHGERSSNVNVYPTIKGYIAELWRIKKNLRDKL